MFVDFNTKNDSFIKVSNKLKEKGIKNFDFMLKTNDDDLKDVDPFSYDLTEEQQEKIKKECRENVWYFLREVVRVPYDGKVFGIPFELNLANCAKIYTDLFYVKTITMIPRQFGKTIAELAFGLYASVCFDKEVILKGKDKNSSLKLKTYLTQMKNLLPAYLRKKITAKVYSKKEEDNYFDCVLFLDDVAFMKDIKDVKFDNSMIVSMNTTPAQIKKGNSAEFVYRLAQSSILWDDHCYDYNPMNFKATKNRYVVIKYSYEDLLPQGVDPEEWFKEQCKCLGEDKEMIDREVLCLWPIDKNIVIGGH